MIQAAVGICDILEYRVLFSSSASSSSSSSSSVSLSGNANGGLLNSALQIDLELLSSSLRHRKEQEIQYHRLHHFHAEKATAYR